MNIQEIIESGIIELYVMNALPEDEAARVEALALAHPEIRMEIEDIQVVLQKYAQAHAIDAKPELKDDILEKIKKNSLPEDLKISNRQPLKVVKHPLSILPWLLTAAASFAAIVLGIQYANQKKETINCAAENAKIIENQKVIAYKLDILRRDDTKTIDMKGLDNVPNAKVLVYWNAKEKATFVSIQNLPQPPKGKQYQLWAIVDKKPVDAGVFVYDLTAVQAMKGFEKAEAFAVTLEPEGGSVEPTLSNMYVLGTVL
ncbi:MAG: anti-sigma factor [Saprospiraceae bacterium]|nr:anti-sigma factor [Saprospiraceae bacterium]